METAAKKQEAGKTKSGEAQDLRDLFEVGLKDIYNAEKVLSKTLPKMLKNASSPELVRTLQNHLNENEQQVSRLEQIFKVAGIKLASKKCEAMEGLLKDGDGIMGETKKGAVRDAGIIAAGQKVKHYEIATYGTLHAYAKTLGEDKAANLLAITLDENKKSDADLTGIAMSAINQNASTARINW